MLVIFIFLLKIELFAKYSPLFYRLIEILFFGKKTAKINSLTFIALPKNHLVK